MRWIFVPIFALLIGCVAPGPEFPPMTDPDTCGQQEFAGFLGQPRVTLEGVTFPGPARIIGPNDIVTQDFVPERINFLINQRDEVDDITCG